MIKLILIKDLPATYNDYGNGGSYGYYGGEFGAGAGGGYGYGNGSGGGCGWDNGSGIG